MRKARRHALASPMTRRGFVGFQMDAPICGDAFFEQGRPIERRFARRIIRGPGRTRLKSRRGRGAKFARVAARRRRPDRSGSSARGEPPKSECGCSEEFHSRSVHTTSNTGFANNGIDQTQRASGKPILPRHRFSSFSQASNTECSKSPQGQSGCGNSGTLKRVHPWRQSTAPQARDAKEGRNQRVQCRFREQSARDTCPNGSPRRFCKRGAATLGPKRASKWQPATGLQTHGLKYSRLWRPVPGLQSVNSLESLPMAACNGFAQGKRPLSFAKPSQAAIRTRFFAFDLQTRPRPPFQRKFRITRLQSRAWMPLRRAASRKGSSHHVAEGRSKSRIRKQLENAGVAEGKSEDGA